MNTLDLHLVHKIRYEFLENPKHTYDNVVKYLKKHFPKTCSSLDCRFRHFYVYEGHIVRPLMLFRQTHVSCKNCMNSISDYSHIYCFSCAPIDSEEFIYHHSRCLKQRQ